MRYASKGDSNVGHAGGDPAAAVADPGCSGDEFAPNRGTTGTDKSDSGAGENYVEVDELARITGGSLRFERNQIILTLPGSGDTSSQAVQSAPTQTVGISRPFLAAGIETMRQILEWHAALKAAIERGYPLSDVWIGNFRRQIQASLKHTEAMASTDMDQKAFPLLTNEFNTMNALTDEYIKITVSRDYLAPNSLNSDPLNQKLLTCSQSLASMASSNQVVDDGSCQ